MTGSVVIDAGSIVSFDPLESATPFVDTDIVYDAAGAPPDREASNWLTVSPSAAARNATLAVMGPQLGYYYPEIVQQIHLSGPGIEAQGAAVPGLSMYILIGRTRDYAWSLTSAGN
ncbi:MAG: penicillin acylase family protein, partial [Actinobacteria bacterium]|nr:penicillin acylase family protein [Actinomycetota bacterium]NIT95767.1 penicillin acylase family protein [Actinomycetota bacterium]NIU19447.1 penicillin acylase family protein [Actinomycetota bacterium]NIV55938.1 penicillin acylase family protein [Actinomycetota bacterium]NIX50752.1 penicillin acylase family protein [Actinomycetota bacterium]